MTREMGREDELQKADIGGFKQGFAWSYVDGYGYDQGYSSY